MKDRMHSLCQGFSNDDFSNANDILMSTRHERIDFAKSSDRKAVFLLIQFKLLQCDDVSCFFVSGPKDDPIRSLFDRVQPFVTIN